MIRLRRAIGTGLLLACAAALSGCVVGTVVGAAVDVGVEVVKIPFKVGKGVYDVLSDDDKPAKPRPAETASAGKGRE